MRKIGVLLVNMLLLVLYTGKAFAQDVRLYPVAEVVRVLATSFEPGTTDYIVIMQHALMARGRIRDEEQFREEMGKSGALGKVRLETVTQSPGDSSESKVFNVTAEMQSRNLVKPKATGSRLRTTLNCLRWFKVCLKVQDAPPFPSNRKAAMGLAPLS